MSISVISIWSNPHSIWALRSWLKADVEIARPRWYCRPPTGVVSPKVGNASSMWNEAARSCRWLALTGIRPGRRRHPHVRSERDPGRVLEDVEERRFQVHLQRFADRPGDRDVAERHLEGVGQRRVGRAGAVGIAEERNQAVQHERLHVPDDQLDDASDDRIVAQAAGVLLVETAETDAGTSDQVHVDAARIRRQRLQLVVPEDLGRVGGDPQTAARDEARTRDLQVHLDVEDVDVSQHLIRLRIDVDRESGDAGRRRGDAHGRAAPAAEDASVDEALVVDDDRVHRQQCGEIEIDLALEDRLDLVEPGVVEAQADATVREVAVRHRVRRMDDDPLA
jgi:hypothetical protein